MQRILQSLAAVGALIFLFVGVAMWVAPTFVAGELGMPLLDGLGRSTQIADIAALFLAMGGCIAVGLVTRNRMWLAPSALILGLASTGRVLAWAVHGASFATLEISVEVFFTVVLVSLIARPNRE
jgi:hypothetical protein